MPHLFVMMLYPFVGMPQPFAATPEPLDPRLHVCSWGIFELPEVLSELGRPPQWGFALFVQFQPPRSDPGVQSYLAVLP